MHRRQFIKSLMMGAAASAMLPLAGLPVFAQSEKATPLPIPALLEGTMKDGVRVFDLNMQRGETEFFPGVKTPTLGINASYLGSTLKMNVGEKVRLNVTNNIGEVTTLHWHGMHLPASADGGPHQTIDEGATWSPEFKVIQEAATFWYHSHMHEKTGEQVWKGLAGVIIVEDEKIKALNLPSNYGVDDIPVVLQERRFNNDGTLQYTTSMHDRMMGMAGNVPLVNGAVTPVFTAKTKKIRMRILNGSNASFYNLGFDDNRSFIQTGSDGSLLPESFETKRMLLAPGERGEIIVNVSNGKNVVLRSFGGGNSGGGMMGGGGGASQFDFMLIQPAASLADSAPIPAKLLNIARIAPESAAKTRKFELEMKMGPAMMLGLGTPFSINGKAMDMSVINEVIKLGDTEIWEISNNSQLPHPFHIHLIQFQILDRNGKAPNPGERGLKDTVVVNPGEVVRIIAKFEHYGDDKLPFMYHCHILEHEDGGMMGQFTVTS